MSYQLYSLKVQDFQNIKIAECEFKGKKMVRVTGKNGAGKSSFIAALFLAITGRKGAKELTGSKAKWTPVRTGQDEALFKAVIGNQEREITITRRITNDGQNLRVQDSRGEKMGQKELDSLLNEFTIDPLAFARLDPKAQAETIKRIAGIDTTPFEEAEKTAADSRLIVGREVDRLKQVVKEVPDFAEVVDLDALIAKRREIEKQNIEIADRDNLRRDTLTRIENGREMQRNKAGMIEQLEKRIQEIVIDQDKIAKGISDLEKDVAAIEVTAPIETEAIDQQISEAGKTNEAAGKYARYLEATEELKAVTETWQGFADAVKKARADKQATIEAADLPFKSVTFDDEQGLLIGGIPFSQRSDAEKVKYSTRIGIELRDGLNVICIRDGSLLDEDSLEQIAIIAEKYDYQLLVETVGEKKGEDCIVISQGRIISEYESEVDNSVELL